MSILFPESYVICDRLSVKNIQQSATLINLLLQEVSFFTEAYILDYFVESFWTKLPSCLLEILKEFDAEDLAIFLNYEETLRWKKPLPLSLLALRKCSSSFSLPRRSITSPKIVENFISLRGDLLISGQNSTSGDQLDWSSAAHEFDEKSKQHKHIPEFCRRHVKPKKQHEIYRLAKVTDALMSSVGGLQHIVDVGSGLGHLSRFLSLSYGFHVATIEANQCNVSGAATFDKQAFRSWKRLKKPDAEFENLPHHTEELISSEKSVRKITNLAWCQEKCSESVKYGVLGLHTCGDLAETLLKTFVKCEEAKVLISVGCCYMKMKDGNYPLSSFVKSLPNHQLSYEAKEMACHAQEMYIKRLRENAPSLKIHCYRATLEKCIQKHYPQYKHLGLRGVKQAELLQFPDYAKQALSKVCLHLPEETLKSPEVEECLSRWKEVLVFYSLRLTMAPVIETLILLDRMLYLYEQGYPSCLAAIFDPSISPRNHVLLSFK